MTHYHERLLAGEYSPEAEAPTGEPSALPERTGEAQAPAPTGEPEPTPETTEPQTDEPA